MGNSKVTFIEGGFTGGGTALDGIAYATLTNNHFAFVCPSDRSLLYRYNTAETAAEDGDLYIVPDDNGTGTGCWVKQVFDSNTMGTVPSTVITRNPICGGDASHGTDTTNDLDFAPLLCMDSTNTSRIYSSASMTKQLDAAWAAGTDAGGLLNGSKAANTVYKWYALLKDSDNSVDFGFLALADSIGTYLPSGYSKYRYLGFRHTTSGSAWAGFTQNGDYVNNWTASENVLSSGITSTYATVDHTVLIDTAHTELIEYGARDAASTVAMYASDDGGTNTAYYVGGTTTTVTDTNESIWGNGEYQKNGLKPFSTSRKFRSSTGTTDLLCQAIKFKR